MSEINLKKGQVKVEISNKNISIGVELDGKGKVTRINPSSVFLGFVYTGDTIITIQDKPVLTSAEFFNTVRNAIPGKVTVVYERDEMYTCTQKTLEPLRPMTEFFEVEITFRGGGSRLGLLIHRDFEGRVNIAVVEDGGPASRYVKAGDFIIKVNNVECKGDREKARALIMEGLNKHKKVKLGLERPIAMKSMMIQPSVIVDPNPAPPASSPSPAASPSVVKTVVIKDGLTSVMEQTSSLMAAPGFKPVAPFPVAADVLQILKEQEKFFKERPATGSIIANWTMPKAGVSPSATSLNVNTATMTPSAATSFTPPPPESQLMYDPSPKELKVTPKRVGS